MKCIKIIFAITLLLTCASLIAKDQTTEEKLELLLKGVSQHLEVNEEQIKFKNESGIFVSKNTFIELYKNNKNISINHDGDLIDDAKNEVSLRLLSEEQIQASKDEKMTSLKNGDQFPGFSFFNTNNKNVDLNSLKGKPTLISFYYSTCIPCIAEVPVLNQLKENIEDSVRMLSVTYETKDEALAFAEKHGFTWEILYETKSLIGDIELKGYPALVLLDEKMRMVDIKIGGASHITVKYLKKWIKQSLNKV